MSEPPALVLALVAGMAIGAIFFGGLWWTVRKSLAGNAPTLWLASSLLVRTILALAGFCYVADGLWQRWLACLAGFVAARPVVAALVRSTSSPGGRRAP